MTSNTTITDGIQLEDYEIFPWSENFATGIACIDEQHKKLVQLLNLLANHVAYQSNNLKLNALFTELTDYACYHFETEEAIWHQFFASDAIELAHQATHHEFVSYVQQLQTRATVTEQTIEETLSFLTHWLAFHILDTDKRMAKVVIAMQAGLSIEQAKRQSESDMSGAMKVLVDSVLAMYDCLSVRTLQLMKEVVERQKIEAKQRLASNVFKNTLDAICIMDANFIVIDVNPAFYQTTGYVFEDIIGQSLKNIKSGINDADYAALWHVLEDKGHWSGKISSYDSNNEPRIEWLTLSCVKDEQGNINNYVAVFSNISHFIEQQQFLEQLAHCDALTQLPNRLALTHRLESALIHAKHQQNFLAVCYLDLDGFKNINDTFGHEAGDQVLKTVAKRLLAIVRHHDTVARLGGDEFVILFSNIDQPEMCEPLLNRVLLEVAQPIPLDNGVAHISASIGITLFPRDQVEPAFLLQHADRAMYAAKKLGKSTYCWYSSELTPSV